MEISKKPGSSFSKNSIFSQIKMLKIPYVVCYLGRKSVDVETLKRLRNTMMSDENSTEAANRYILSKVNKSFFYINRPLKRVKDADGSPTNARLLLKSPSSIFNDLVDAISKKEVHTPPISNKISVVVIISAKFG